MSRSRRPTKWSQAKEGAVLQRKFSSLQKQGPGTFTIGMFSPSLRRLQSADIQGLAWLLTPKGATSYELSIEVVNGAFCKRSAGPQPHGSQQGTDSSFCMQTGVKLQALSALPLQVLEVHGIKALGPAEAQEAQQRPAAAPANGGAGGGAAGAAGRPEAEGGLSAGQQACRRRVRSR